MAFAREIIKQILIKVPFQADNKEKDSYYTMIGGTLVRVSNHCTRLYVWDNFLEQNPKCKGMPIVSIVFEDNEDTFNEEECLTLKRFRKNPIKIKEYVYSLNGDAHYLSKQDEKGIIGNIRRVNGSFADPTGKSVPYERISRNPDDGVSASTALKNHSVKSKDRVPQNISVDKDGNYVPANGRGADYVLESNNKDNYIKTEQYMRKNRTMRLTESRLRGIIREAIKGILHESQRDLNKEQWM